MTKLFYRAIIALAGLAALSSTRTARAEEPSPPSVTKSDEADDDFAPNVVGQTLGGKQFWGDVRFFHDWHIQRNAFTGHYRLLDGEQQRHAWGTFEHCQAALEAIRREQKLPPMQGKVVILLHGLFRSAGAMESLGEHLERNSDYTVIRFAYPSTRSTLGVHAEALESVIHRLEGVTEINLVGHSLGNLVIRRYLHQTTDPQTGRQGDPRIKRIVMLAPPNQGSQVGELLIPIDVTHQIVGPAGQRLATDWEQLSRQLATPRMEFGILAGGKNDNEGFNPLLDGDDDFVVEVASTKLAGARDFRIVPALHSVFMNHADVQKLTLRFLQTGYFETAVTAQPLK